MNLRILLSFLLVSLVFPLNFFGQKINSLNSHQNNETNLPLANSVVPFANPVVVDAAQGCRAENLQTVRFDAAIDLNQRLFFCEALQEIAAKLNKNWSPALQSEIQEMWNVFLREDVKIFPMKKSASSKIVAAAEAFPNNTPGANFNAGLHLRIEKAKDRAFFLSFMHEVRHVYDYHQIWKNRSSLSEAEMEKRAFRLMGKISQEMADGQVFSRVPTFWKAGWKKLSPDEIAAKREEKIEKFMRGNKFYKHLLKSPEKYMVGYTNNQQPAQKMMAELASEKIKDSKNEALPMRLAITQSREEIPQNIKEISFTPEKPQNKQNPDELLRAAVKNEKNLYHKMDNFVYDQTFQLQCWKKQKVVENFEVKKLVARTQSGETLFQNANAENSQRKLPSCIPDFDSISTDAAETFWAASYLDQMPVQFAGYTTLDGIPVARYTVLQPTDEKFRQIAKRYSQIKNFRVFIGTIFVAVEDAQIIRFWGTSFPKASVTGSQTVKADYCATAVRQKLATGIWVTTLLNTVAVATTDDKMKPYSYVAKYTNYRQATSDVVISDEIVAGR